MAQLKEQIHDSDLNEIDFEQSVNPGELLKQTRLNLKLSTAQVSDSLRISERYIIAIEEQNTKDMPEQVYTLGFVRTYSLFLGLDADNIVNQFKQSINLTKGTILDFPIPEKSSSAPKATVILVSLVVIALIYALWAVSDTNKNTAQVTPQEEPIVAQPVKTPVIDNVAGAQREITTETKAATTSPPEDNFVTLEEFFVVPGQYLNVTASELSWVEIKDKHGKNLLNANLNPGETQSVMITESVTISTGNAGGISLSTGNLKTKAIGSHGQVLHYFEVPFKVLS